MSKSPYASLGTILATITDASYLKATIDRFAKGQCTWYAAGRAHEKKGVNITALLPPSDCDACKWYAKITTNDKVAKHPASEGAIVDSIAVFAHGTCGHVVYVEAIKDGWVYYTEYNWNQAQNGVLQRVAATTFAKLHGSCTLLGSIVVR
jgi:surface antigen